MIKNSLIALFILTALISCGGCSGSGPTGPTGYTVSFTPETASAGGNYVALENVSVAGDSVTIAAKATGIFEPVGGMALDFEYDPAKLSFVSASNGGLVSGSTVSFMNLDNNGRVVISASDVSDASPSSSGTLFTITLKGKAAGNGAVSITNATFFNAAGNVISGVSWYGGTVTVQ